jgi:TPR repeat protein
MNSRSQIAAAIFGLTLTFGHVIAQDDTNKSSASLDKLQVAAKAAGQLSPVGSESVKSKQDADYQTALGLLADETNPINQLKARTLLQEASERGHLGARHQLALIKLNGPLELTSAGAAANTSWEEARMMIEENANDGYAESQSLWGQLILENEDQTPDKKNLAFDWFKKAAVQGNVTARLLVAACLIDGCGVEANPNEGFKILDKLANEENNAEAKYQIGFRAISGTGVVPDREKGRRWLESAAKQGHQGAKKILSDMDELDAMIKRSIPRPTKPISLEEMMRNAHEAASRPY